MSCDRPKSVSLAANQQLRSNPDGTKRIYWSDDLGFETDAVFVKLLILFNSDATLRFVARSSVDGATWKLVDTTGGYIDGLGSGSYAALGMYSFQYLGDEDVHGPHFQIGILVEGTGTVEGVVTLSAEATFGPVRLELLDLTATVGTLATAAVPTLIPGADTVSTYGCARVRISIVFNSSPVTPVTLYLATGDSPTSLCVDHQTKLTASLGTETTLSFVVEGPAAWSTVYYSVPTTTTGTVARLYLSRMP